MSQCIRSISDDPTGESRTMGVFGKTETGRVVVQDGDGGSGENGGWEACRAGSEVEDILAGRHDCWFELGVSKFFGEAVPAYRYVG